MASIGIAQPWGAFIAHITRSTQTTFYCILSFFNSSERTEDIKLTIFVNCYSASEILAGFLMCENFVISGFHQDC